ncbi:hypothetical protein CBL_02746 [Carabus blaptoides fortunei]
MTAESWKMELTCGVPLRESRVRNSRSEFPAFRMAERMAASGGGGKTSNKIKKPIKCRLQVPNMNS